MAQVSQMPPPVHLTTKPYTSPGEPLLGSKNQDNQIQETREPGQSLQHPKLILKSGFSAHAHFLSMGTLMMLCSWELLVLSLPRTQSLGVNPHPSSGLSKNSRGALSDQKMDRHQH